MVTEPSLGSERSSKQLKSSNKVKQKPTNYFQSKRSCGFDSQFELIIFIFRILVTRKSQNYKSKNAMSRKLCEKRGAECVKVTAAFCEFITLGTFKFKIFSQASYKSHIMSIFRGKVNCLVLKYFTDSIDGNFKIYIYLRLITRFGQFR